MKKPPFRNYNDPWHRFLPHLQRLQRLARPIPKIAFQVLNWWTHDKEYLQTGSLAMKWYPHRQVNSHPATGGESNSRLRNFSASRGDQVAQFLFLSILPDAQIWAVFVSLICWCKNVMVIWCAFTELIECQSTKIKYKPNIFYGETLSVQFEFDLFFKYNSVTQGGMS